MMKPHNTRLCASAAIAAALALSPPLLAATAPAEPAPVLVIPEVSAPAPAQPTMTIPTELPVTSAPPATATAPEPRTTTATTARTERAAPRPATPAPLRAPVAAPADPAPVAAEEAAAPIAPEPAVETAAPVAAIEPAAAPVASNEGDTQFWVAAVAALAAIALAIWGFIAIGRRRPADRKAAMIIERPVVKPREPVAEPLAGEPRPAPSVSPLRTATPAPSMAHTGASVPLPSEMPKTFEERDALLKRMIAARPDRANPFTSPFQRRKRARLILQSLGRDFGDQDPRIDLSQYPANWPELARRNQAAA